MRIEKDSMGEMEVPQEALYGASTQRAVLNFPISGHKMPEDFIKSMGLLKFACAQANEDLGRLPKEKADAIRTVANEIYEGQWLEHFPVDVFQTGSATSSNMNINEVIANRASQIKGKAIGSKDPLHPNDDVNLGQSSNDTMPTVLHLSVALALRQKLIPALEAMHARLHDKAQAWGTIVKIGRTHLMDATPLTMGQVFSGYAAQLDKSIKRAQKATLALRELAIGGTAVGTGINGHPEFPGRVIRILTQKTGIDFCEASNHFEAQAARDDCLEVAGYIQAIAASLTKIANDIRYLGSGPRSGLAELNLPATQPGSSIMPGKVNPVMSEMLVQACLYTMGLCNTVTMAGRDGHFELNVTIPLIAYSLHESIEVIANSVVVFTKRCIEGLEVNEERCRTLVEQSLMLVTALNPYIGYDNAAKVAKKAFKENKTLKCVVLEEGLMDEASLDQALEPLSMTHPPQS